MYQCHKCKELCGGIDVDVCVCVSAKPDIKVTDSCCRDDKAACVRKERGENVCVCLLNAKSLAEERQRRTVCVCIRLCVSINLIEWLLGRGTGSCKAEGMRF